MVEEEPGPDVERQFARHGPPEQTVRMTGAVAGAWCQAGCRALRGLHKLFYFGNGRTCPVCGCRSPRFAPIGVVPRADAQCLHCGALERHRLSWLFVNARTNLLDGRPKRMLHLAPEPCLADRLRQRLGDGYLTADLRADRALVQMDVSNIPCADGTFEVIYCSHVLEHVQDDKRAMRELLRVLHKDGWAILLVPVTSDRTFEDPSVTDPQDRLAAFGQEDHVRRYGQDYADRLREAGFTVAVTRVADLVDAEDAVAMGLTPASGEIYYCTK